MQSDDTGRAADKAPKPELESQDKTLRWLLEQDMEEPSEKVFRVTDNSRSSVDLNEFETAVARRPMFGGNDSADDLSAFVDEEIVLSGMDGSSDIYTRPSAEASELTAGNGYDIVAIDHRRHQETDGVSDNSIDDGTDILGLLDDDDIGSQPLALQRKAAPKIQIREATSVAAGSEAIVRGQTIDRNIAAQREESPAETLPAVTDPVDDTGVVQAPDSGVAPVEEVALHSNESGDDRHTVANGGWLSDLAEDFDLINESALSLELDESAAVDDLSELENSEPVEEEWFSCAEENAEQQWPADDSLQSNSLDPVDELDMSMCREETATESAPAPAMAPENPPGTDAQWQADHEPMLPVSLEADDSDLDLSDAAGPAVVEDRREQTLWAPGESAVDAVIPATSPVTDGVKNLGRELSPARLEAQSETDPEPEAGDVFSYVNNHVPPVDDGEFDRYLLRGEHLEETFYDFESLAVERTEGVVSVDPSLDSDLDYHQDFSLPQDFSPATVEALTQVLAPVMQELSQAVELRLKELQLPADSVVLDAMLATDPLSCRQCADGGYAPVVSVWQAPAVLQALDSSEQLALCVRLVFRDSGEPCNDLFQQGFTAIAPLTEVAAESWSIWRHSGQAPGDRGAEHGTASAAPGLLLDCEPANDADLVGEPVAPDWSGVDSREAPTVDRDSRIDALAGLPEGLDLEPPKHEAALLDWMDETIADDESDTFSMTDGDWLSEPGLPDDEGVLALLDEVALEMQDELAVADEAFGSSVPVPAPAPGLELPSAGSDKDPYAEPDTEQVFEALNIFSSAELDDWDADDDTVLDVDVDALFESLGASSEADIGDICGVEVAEFDSTETAEDLVEPAVGSQPVAELPVSAAIGSCQSDDAQRDDSRTAASPETANSAWCIPANIRFNSTSPGSSELFRDFLNAFLEEGAVEIEKLEDAVGQWEQDFESAAGSDVVPRVLHNLKGIAKGVGLQRYGTFIHNFETLLAALARPAPGAEEAYFSIVNAWLDTAVQGFEHIRNTKTDVLSELPQVKGWGQPHTVEDSAVVIDSDSEVRAGNPVRTRERQQDKQLADEGAKVLTAQQTIRMTSGSLDHLLNLNNQAQQLGVRASQSTLKSKRAAVELLARLSSVRLHITKIADRALQNVTARGGQVGTDLDALEMDQYSELQEAANILREGIEDLDDLIHVSTRQTASAEALLKQQASVVSSLGSAIRDARVVPVSRLMPGLRRIVRTVGADLGKAVNFRVLNEVGKLDRDSHVCCQVILEHMVRNALDHGIELPEARRAAGKPETGQISIDVSKDGSDYLIKLSDDGRGIDPALLRETAYTRGLDVNVSELSDRDVLRLIFHKGFSTAAKLSEISGRGVGMDIVLSELQQIGGEIDIESTLGVGTNFTVRIPSNVNVNGALLVTAGESSYAIPLDGLIAVEHVSASDFYRAITSGKSLPVYDMECDPAYLATLCHGEQLPDPGSWLGDSVPVMIAGTEERYMALAVDDVAEALELVIRSLGAQFSQVPGVAGGATTSDGQAIVALDLNALVRSYAASDVSTVTFERETNERMLVLVVDDSRTQRMVATSQFDTLGVETVTAENGMVAIDMLNTTHRLPDVVLLDVEMPVKDGIQTLREIRRSARYKHLPVIMVTSRTGPKHRALAQEAGCNGYMGKPFNFPVLVEQIVQLTGHELQVN